MIRAKVVQIVSGRPGEGAKAIPEERGWSSIGITKAMTRRLQLRVGDLIKVEPGTSGLARAAMVTRGRKTLFADLRHGPIEIDPDQPDTNSGDAPSPG
jgi:hypothetical protein